MNANLTTVISYYDINGNYVNDEDFNIGKIYPFRNGRNSDWLSHETQLSVYLNDEYSFCLWGGNPRNIQTQLERREELFKEVAKLEEAGADLELYFQIASYESEIIPTEEFLTLAGKVQRVKDLEEWAEGIVRQNQKDEDFGELIVSYLDYSKLIEKFLEELKLTACETGEEWLLYPTR